METTRYFVLDPQGRVLRRYHTQQESQDTPGTGRDIPLDKIRCGDNGGACATVVASCRWYHCGWAARCHGRCLVLCAWCSGITVKGQSKKDPSTMIDITCFDGDSIALEARTGAWPWCLSASRHVLIGTCVLCVDDTSSNPCLSWTVGRSCVSFRLIPERECRVWVSALVLHTGITGRTADDVERVRAGLCCAALPAMSCCRTALLHALLVLHFAPVQSLWRLCT